MRGRGGVIANQKLTSQPAWSEPMTGGMLKHRRFVWIKRGGVGRQSGSGPSGCKATPRALLSRTLRDRAGVAAVVTARQELAYKAKATPPKIIYGRLPPGPLPYDNKRFVIIDGRREYAPVGTHLCHDGVEYALNGGGFCDRCGENVEKLSAHLTEE